MLIKDSLVDDKFGFRDLLMLSVMTIFIDATLGLPTPAQWFEKYSNWLPTYIEFLSLKNNQKSLNSMCHAF